ncbi:MAG: LLM class flavin-dependent oxidoreductase [Pseudomonadota bacterium]
MKFSAHVSTRVSDWQLIKELEDWGYDAAWIPDTQMMWSDCYAVMALAAHHTSKIRLGTGVAVPGTRIAPTTAAAISTINAIAPGRVFLGIGTGHTAMRVMGQNPMTIKNFKEYVRVVKAMLNNEEVEYTYGKRSTWLKWQDHGDGFRNTEQKIPIYIAANGPKALASAGELGDGLVSVFNEQPAVLEYNLSQVRAGADAAGRALPNDFYTTALASAVIVRDGEDLNSPRVREVASSYVASATHFVYEIWRFTKDDAVVPEYMKDIWEEYCDHVAGFDVPEDKIHQVLHEGHCSYCPAGEMKFVTPEMIEGTHLVGTPEEIAKQLRDCEALGLSEVSLLPGLAHARDVLKEFSEKVMPLM